MKHSFLILFAIIISFVFISISTSCRQSNLEPRLSFTTEYSANIDSISLVDFDNTTINIELTDIRNYTHFTYTVANDSVKIHSNDTLELSNHISIDLKKASHYKKYKNHNLSLSVTLIGEGVNKTFEHDVDYHVDLTSPIPYVNITTKDGKFPKKDKIKLEAEFDFYDVPMEDGWYRMSGPHQSGKGTIHARGQGSLDFPKLSFALNLGKDNPISIMGMPASHKWVMIGNWIDTSHLCNKVSYDTYAEMGHYGPQSKHVQVFLNGEYWGLYTFGEKIQRGENHVDTKKKSKGGFIVKEVDNREATNFTTLSGRRFAYEYPDNEEVTDEQKVDIQEKINLYEDKVEKGLDWQENVNEEAEIDYFLVTDVFANPDSYYNGKNVFYFYNRDNKLEPVIWDFIWSFGTPYYVCDGNNPWCYIYSPVGEEYCRPDTPCTFGIPFGSANELMYGNPKYNDYLGYNRFLLMKDYMKNAQNVNMFKNRYQEWRQGGEGKKAVLSDAEILSRTDELINLLRSGNIYKKDSLRWENEDKFQYGKRFTPEQVRSKIKERLIFMDNTVKNLNVKQ